MGAYANSSLADAYTGIYSTKSTKFHFPWPQKEHQDGLRQRSIPYCVSKGGDPSTIIETGSSLMGLFLRSQPLFNVVAFIRGIEGENYGVFTKSAVTCLKS